MNRPYTTVCGPNNEFAKIARFEGSTEKKQVETSDRVRKFATICLKT